MEANTISYIFIALSAVNVVVLLVLVSKLARLSKQIPGTGATAKEIADELGGSIESSFEKFMPKPEKVADAITSAVESSLKSASTGLGEVEKAISTASSSLGTGLSGGSEKLSAALTEGSEKMQASLKGGSEKLDAAISGGSVKLEKALTEGSQKVSEALTGGTSKLETALKEHAEKTAQASKELSSQLDKIAALEKDIDKLLHIQQATEGTLKSVTATDDFKNLVTGLRTHLEASDKVLKELTKPRQIRLVEEE